LAGLSLGILGITPGYTPKAVAFGKSTVDSVTPGYSIVEIVALGKSIIGGVTPGYSAVAIVTFGKSIIDGITPGYIPKATSAFGKSTTDGNTPGYIPKATSAFGKSTIDGATPGYIPTRPPRSVRASAISCLCTPEIPSGSRATRESISLRCSKDTLCGPLLKRAKIDVVSK
jgi:hypothetical protein